MALDLSSMWLPELEMENRGFMNQDDMSKPYDIEDKLNVNHYDIDSFTDRSFQTPTSFEEQFEMKPASYSYKASSINTMCQTPKAVAATSVSSSNTFTISFGELIPKELGIEVSGTGKVQTMAMAPVQVQDHVLAERKRREKLNRQLIALSALLPNLKKMDKASVLEDTTNYIRELQDRVKELEGLSLIKRKEAKECIIASKKSRIRGDDDGTSSSNETNSADCCADDDSSKSSTEIEVRMSGSSVLVTIQSQKNPSLLGKVLSMMQKLGLSISSSSAMPFANTTTLITIVAQVYVLRTNHFTRRKMSPSLCCF
ncbi:putative transcription factor bHLH family [Helianthus annuus]|uniref:Transcription factor bHLH family n=2 Tax=Helianthus annuus TaxID=4232 RepID=A0A9K3MYA3_HELAN|nr:putative transcription factor bHLH family [Helianthus annuus]